MATTVSTTKQVSTPAGDARTLRLDVFRNACEQAPPEFVVLTSQTFKTLDPASKGQSVCPHVLRQPAQPFAIKRSWWVGGATAIVVAYILTSQALVDLAGWSFLAFACAALLSGLLVVGNLFGIWKLWVGNWLWLPVAFICYCVLRSFSGTKDTHPFDVLASLTSAFVGGIAIAVALRIGVRFRWLAYAQVASNLLQILIVLFGLGPAPDPGEDTFRYAGITGNANTLALQLTLGACMIWLLPRKAGLFPCLFAVGAVGFALAVTGSRKAVLVAFFFLVLVCIQLINLFPKGRYRRVWIALTIATPCLLGLVLAPTMYEHAKDVLAIKRALEYEDSSYLTRAEMIRQGLELWQQAPFFGNGLDSFRGLSGQGTYAHNNYVELLSGIGLVGALLFYAIHGQVLMRAAWAPRFLKQYCCIFILLLLLTDIGYVSYKSKQSIMILMLLMVITTSRYALKQQHSIGRPVIKPVLKKLRVTPRRFVVGS